jgi:hypothetical protein
MRTQLRTPALLAGFATLIVISGIRCDGTTGDHRVRFGGTVVSSGADGMTARGWSLHFDQFLVALGPVRVYSDDAFISQHRPRPRVQWPFGIGVAFAQHCHGCPRAPVAEFGFESGGAVFSAVDLLAQTPFSMGPANARNGWYRSVSFTFASPITIPDGGINAAALDGHSMRIRGTATRDGMTIPFVGSIDLHPQEVLNDPTTERPYTTYGVMFDNPSGVFIDDANEATDHVAIRIELARMFDQADFETLTPGATPDEPRNIDPESQVAIAWRFGVDDPRTYRVGWVGTNGHGDPSDAPVPVLDAGR